MGYDSTTGRCDEQCSGCTYTRCVEHPRHGTKDDDGAFEGKDIVCPNCGETFTQEEKGQRFCSLQCQEEFSDGSVSALTWIRRRGYKGKKDFVADWDEETWRAIQ